MKVFSKAYLLKFLIISSISSSILYSFYLSFHKYKLDKTNKPTLVSGQYDSGNYYEINTTEKCLATLKTIIGGDYKFNCDDVLLTKSIKTIFEKNIDLSTIIVFSDTSYFLFFKDKIISSGEQCFVDLFQNEFLCFSVFDGFVVKEPQSDIYYKVDIETGKVDYCDEIEPAEYDKTSYDAVDGQLNDSNIDSYMAEQHPTWNFVSAVLTSGYFRQNQYNTSFYFKHYHYQDGNYGDVEWSEGNCAVNAMTNYFVNLPIVSNYVGVCYNYCPNLLSGNVNVNRYAYFSSMLDTFSYQLTDNYYSYTDVSGKPPSETIVSEHWRLRKSWSSLWNSDKETYWYIREKAIDYGFNPRSGFQTRDYGETVMENVAYNKFGYNINIVKTNSTSNVVNNINYGIPVVVSAQNSLSYHNHAMLIYGYRLYSYEVNIIQFPFIPTTETRYAFVWMVDDNWNASVDHTWFDPNRGSSTVFLTTERNSIVNVWPSC